MEQMDRVLNSEGKSSGETQGEATETVALPGEQDRGQ